MLKERRALTKLRIELEGRKGKLCKCCRRFGHLVCNCRNKRREKEGTVVPQNKFEVLGSRVMQCGIEERVIRSIRAVVVKCFRYGVEGHKCRECPLWVKKERAVCMAMPQKAQQERRPARPVRGEVQERKLRKVE